MLFKSLLLLQEISQCCDITIFSGQILQFKSYEQCATWLRILWEQDLL